MQYSNKQLVDLTVDEFRELMHQELDNQNTPVEYTGCSTTEPKRLAYGLRGIQELFHCSHKQAQFYKDHIISQAVMQHGRKIVVDADLALKLFDERRKK